MISSVSKAVLILAITASSFSLAGVAKADCRKGGNIFSCSQADEPAAPAEASRETRGDNERESDREAK